MTISTDEYCVQVCKAKCCTMQHPEDGRVTCPRLRDDARCGVYHKRYAPGQPDVAVVGYYKSLRYKDLDGRPANKPFYCGRIEQLLQTPGAIPQDVREQCCYAHPELLEQYTMKDGKVTLESGKLSEREVRDAIARTAKIARERDQARGLSDRGQDRVSSEVTALAEADKQKGKFDRD